MHKVWASLRVEIGGCVLAATVAPHWTVKYMRPPVLDATRLRHLSLGPLQVSVWRWPAAVARSQPYPRRAPAPLRDWAN